MLARPFRARYRFVGLDPGAAPQSRLPLAIFCRAPALVECHRLGCNEPELNSKRRRRFALPARSTIKPFVTIDEVT